MKQHTMKENYDKMNLRNQVHFFVPKYIDEKRSKTTSKRMDEKIRQKLYRKSRSVDF